MVERSGRIVPEKHDVRCIGKLRDGRECNAILFKTRSTNGKLREHFAHALEIKCRKCGLLNVI